ncbi:hypothetical protein ADS79_02010 [Brevibacillus reuszeri]|uniref:Uncharacterized protein n=1 Tax=Brevibacillus reuszeri TaxID=54915 RepID=A0A0K9Z0H0_9BACL|nr:hypothetical protein ADS79_02010 [Brevibacillus reuszeri]
MACFSFFTAPRSVFQRSYAYFSFFLGQLWWLTSFTLDVHLDVLQSTIARKSFTSMLRRIQYLSALNALQKSASKMHLGSPEKLDSRRSDSRNPA